MFEVFRFDKTEREPSEYPGGNDPTSPSRYKRNPVYTACFSCRRRKTKCDGQRPACAPCQRRGVPCDYDIDPDLTRAAAMRKRYESTQKELRDFWELYDMLRSRSEVEAQEILRRIRAKSDPAVVLDLVREGDLLIQRQSGGAQQEDTEMGDVKIVDGEQYFQEGRRSKSV